jgi:hypothetical protein
MWMILAIVAGVALVMYFGRGNNPVWGGMTIGLMGGLVVAIVVAVMGSGFHWSTIGKGAVVGALFGVVAELLPGKKGQSRG